ncbi:transposable element Tc3 transposase [Trichonephila clavipes]|nr:transposable element Tc3 transposase [Trichonephila clavipes]
MRGRIIGKIEEGRKITDVAREFDIAHSVVSRLWKSFKTTGMCSRRHGGGRVRSTTPAEDRYIVLYQQKGTGAPQLSRWQISFLLPQESRSPEKLLPDDCLDSEGIQRLVWPARSPDLNPIENVWDALGRPVANRNYPPTNKNTLIRALTEEWDKLPQQLLDNVVQRTAIRGFSSGRPRGTTPADDRYIVLQARRNRRQTAGEIARHTTQATGRPISHFTVARRLHGGGLFARCPVRDESRFSLSSDSHRILIWRERGSRNHPSNINERDRYGGRGVLVWGGIMLGSRTDLLIFDAGSVNGTRYCNEILLPYVRLFRGAMGLQFLFMDDNAPCHLTVAAEQLLESEDIERMDWPARSPDLNPIEHVWDFLGRCLTARTLPPVTIRELRLALQDEWAAMPQQLIDILILSMGRRCETCLAVRGDHIPY